MSISDDNKKMDKELMISALSRLNEKLQSSDETGEIILFGGAVMCQVFGSRGYTRDIDAVFEPKGSIYGYAREVAEEEGLPSNWLNDGVEGWLYVEPETELVMQFSNLKVLGDDLNDAKVLITHLGLTDRMEYVWSEENV